MKRSRLNAVSQKRRAMAAEYAAFVLGIKARDEWRCRYCREATGPLDPHHTMKPRARYLTDPETVVTLCRACHDRCSGPFDRGRLIVTPLGQGAFSFRLVFARDKAHAVAAGVL